MLTPKPAMSILATPLFCAAPVLAAGDAGGGSIFYGDFGNAIWTLIIFILVLFVLGKFAWGPILKVLQNREAFIRESLASAKREREESERLLREYTDKIHEAREEATAIVEEGRRDAEEVRKRIHAEARAEADAMIERAKKEINIARDDAVKQLHDQSVLLATEIAGKMIRRQLQPQDHQKLLDESLEELERLSV